MTVVSTAREKGTPILQKKALKYSEGFKKGGKKFVASISWLGRWKKCYGDRQLSVCSKKISGDMGSVSKFEGLFRDHTYNWNETELLPDDSLASKNENYAPRWKEARRE